MYYTWHVKSNWTAWDSVAVAIAAVTLYGVWRLWRGMRLDAFQRSVRTLRQQPQKSMAFPRRPRTAAKSTGILQISLLPLMLISTGLAILLAQTQRPDDLSRAVTWMLFVTVGTWYATWAWPARRGVGPLRNFAFAGVASATCISAALWAFYIGVDWLRGDGTFTRLTASGPVLLWWTAMGGVVGAILGTLRSNRIYAKVNVAEADDANWEAAEVAVANASRTTGAKWPAMLVACGASLLFHVSAAPHLYREVYVRYWYWGDHYHHHWNNSLSLTMSPISAPSLNPLVDTFNAPLPPDWNPRYVEMTRESSPATTNPFNDIPQIVTQRVSIASRNIKSGQRINANMVRVESWPMDKIPNGVSFNTDVSQLVGTIARVDIVPGELIADSQVFRPNVPDGSNLSSKPSTEGSDFSQFQEVSDMIAGNVADQRTGQPASPDLFDGSMTQAGTFDAEQLAQTDRPQGPQREIEIAPALGNVAGATAPTYGTEDLAQSPTPQASLPGGPNPFANPFEPVNSLPPGTDFYEPPGNPPTLDIRSVAEADNPGLQGGGPVGSGITGMGGSGGAIGSGGLPEPDLDPAPVSASEQRRAAIQRIDSGIQSLPSLQQNILPDQVAAAPGQPAPPANPSPPQSTTAQPTTYNPYGQPQPQEPSFRPPASVPSTGTVPRAPRGEGYPVPQQRSGPPVPQVPVPQASGVTGSLVPQIQQPTAPPQLATQPASGETSEPIRPIPSQLRVPTYNLPQPLSSDPDRVGPARPSNTLDGSGTPPVDPAPAKPSNTKVDVKQLQIETAPNLNDPFGDGILVKKVTKGGVADLLGIRAGDVILGSIDDDNGQQSFVVVRDNKTLRLRLPQQFQ